MSAKRKADNADEEQVEVDTRGQIAVHLDGVDYVLRPSWEAIEAIERQLRPLFDLANDASRGSLNISDMAVIVAEMMKAYGKTLPNDDEAVASYRGAKASVIAPMIFAAGAPMVLARVMVILVNALNGGYTAEGELKPMTTA